MPGQVPKEVTKERYERLVDVVNDIDYGLTSGLHSLDRGEISRWLGRIEAGNLYVNRGITGAIVRRQPFGGWKRSAIGAGTKAGGPNYLHGLVDWRDAPVTAPAHAPRPAVAPLLAAAESAGIDGLDWLRAALGSDAAAWDDEYGVARDASQLGVERNALRYLPVPVVVRAAADAAPAQVVRALAAGLAAGAIPLLSTAHPLAPPIVAALRGAGVAVHVEDADAWASRIRALAAVEGPRAGARVRVVAGDARAAEVAAVYAAAQGKPDIAVYGGPVVSAGRVEMLPHLHEQAVSITAHRFGTPSDLADLSLGVL